jgi:O-antigen ligase
MIFVAGFAVLSEYGFDPTDSYDKTHGPMKDRLILNLGIFNNPNALGHSIVPAVVMLYFIGIWKRPIFARMTAPLAMAVPLYCTFLTLSKGAFLSGSVTLASALSFKRPKAIQLAIVVACATLGVVAVKNLPRMQELQSSKRDEAIQGRVHAFRFGFEKMQNEPYGIGYANFIAKFEQRFHYRKAAHSTYVNIGAELGKTGLFLFCALLYFSFRVLLAAKTTNDEEERVRRLLFVLLISFCVSSWMIGWHNRVTFWLMIAAIAAFHRIMLDKRAAALARQVTAPTEITPLPALAYASPQARPAGVLNQIALQANPSSTDDENAAPADPDLIGIQWNRPKWFDWIFMFAVLYGVIYMWDYAIKHM